MKKLTKRAPAGGLWFDVRPETTHIAADADGEINEFVVMPEPNASSGAWIRSSGYRLPLCIVDLDGKDWRECCWYVGDQKLVEDSRPFAWHYDWASYVTCEGPKNFEPCFGYEAPPDWGISDGRVKNLVPLYARPDESDRLEWMARGAVMSSEQLSDIAKSLSPKSSELIKSAARACFILASRIRSGEVEV